VNTLSTSKVCKRFSVLLLSYFVRSLLSVQGVLTKYLRESLFRNYLLSDNTALSVTANDKELVDLQYTQLIMYCNVNKQ